MSSSYHPDYFKTQGAHRVDCEHRLEMIEKVFGYSVPSILDVGCSGGYYSFGLRKKAIRIDAIDREKDLIDGCKEIAKREGVDNIVFEQIALADYLLIRPPLHAVCLYMSVHHHVIQAHGWEMANYMLRHLSVNSPMMFFDMGQYNENCPSTGWWKYMTFTNDNEAWVADYLKENTSYETIECIGSSEVHGTDRFFFQCRR